ncbi:MAG: hypothetical protein IK095_00480 [Oscillospiraceae bacterium]|nr:hypothetical protein [Oscillospiraceae bacterium]
MDRYERMMDAAVAARKVQAAAAQILVTETRDGELSAFASDLSAGEEERFLAAQQRTLAAVLCVWRSGLLDVPSIRVRRGLLGADPLNADALVYLQGEHGIVARTLVETV